MALLKINGSVDKDVGGNWRKVVHVLWMDRETKICNCGRELIQINLLSNEFSISAEPRSSPHTLGKKELKKKMKTDYFIATFICVAPPTLIRHWKQKRKTIFLPEQ